MLTRCHCKLTDCAFYHAVANAGPTGGDCDCSHTDKPHYMINPCPLYRKDWQKNAGAVTTVPGFKKKR